MCLTKIATRKPQVTNAATKKKSTGISGDKTEVTNYLS